jgi:hypothetical protein
VTPLTGAIGFLPVRDILSTSFGVIVTPTASRQEP